MMRALSYTIVFGSARTTLVSSVPWKKKPKRSELTAGDHLTQSKCARSYDLSCVLF